MGTGLHRDLSYPEIHIIHRYEYANEAAREGATGFVADDIGRAAKQTDNNTFWLLIGTEPTWIKLGVVKNNYTATVNPTVNDDSDDGYEAGSVWVNTTTDEAFICTDASVGSAVWRQTSISTSNPGPYLFEINPANLYRSGNKGAGEVEGFAISEFAQNVSEYGVFSLRWRRSPANTTKLYVTFMLKDDAGAGDVVRIYARTKAVAVGENADTVPFSASQAQDVSVSNGDGADTYEAILTLTPADYAKGDQVAINVGRDGTHANDDFGKAVFITTIQGEVV